jgi:phage terminase small subunit
MAELTNRQRKSIAALLSTSNVVEAAKVSKVGERTLYRWLTLPEFRSAVTEAEGEAIDAAARRLIGLQDSAISTIQEVLAKASAAIKLRAAQTILDYLLKLRELRSIENRLTELEKAVQNGK